MPHLYKKRAANHWKTPPRFEGRESERRAEARQREENRGGWLSWYRRLERGYLERAAECGRRADALELDGAPKGAA